MTKNKFDPEFAAGIWPCVVLSGGVGDQPDNNGKATGRIVARVIAKFEDGPDRGRLVTYEDEINAKSSLYVGRSLKAVGWKGGPLADVAPDIEKWVKETGGKSTVEIRHIETKRGKRYDEWVEAGCPGGTLIWAKANSFGRGPRALAAPSAEALSDAEEQMRRAMAEDGATPDDAPHAADDPDSIPF